jgi:GAF domain-containing protein
VTDGAFCVSRSGFSREASWHETRPAVTSDLNPHKFAELAKALQSAPTPVRTAEQVISFAVHQLDADCGGIVLIHRAGRLETIAATDPLVQQVDTLQNELHEGPCRDSSWRGEALFVADLRSDARWPRWASKVADLGIRSLLAVEVNTHEGRPAGSINLYWRLPRVLQSDDAAFVNIFARHAALALSASLEIAELSVALDGRKLIGQAQGILMERYGLDGPHAFEVLRRYSQDHNLKLRRVAEYLVSTRQLPTDGGVASRRLGTDELDQAQERY